MSEKVLRFKGLSISKEDFEEKYGIQLTLIEWHNLITIATHSWEGYSEELRLYAFHHIKHAMQEMGYKPTLNGSDITFEKK